MRSLKKNEISSVSGGFFTTAGCTFLGAVLGSSLSFHESVNAFHRAQTAGETAQKFLQVPFKTAEGMVAGTLGGFFLGLLLESTRQPACGTHDAYYY